MTDQQIMVVSRERLLSPNTFQGFSPHSKFDYESLILRNYGWIEREPVENNPSFKQPIVYSVIFNPKTRKFFVYQRSKKDQNYGEKRLQGKRAWGIGGHVDKQDASPNPLTTSQKRELAEEIEEFKNPKFINQTRPLGYINDDEDDVGKVHFGVAYLISTNLQTLTLKDKEIDFGGFHPINELEAMCLCGDVNVENWSRILVPQLKKVAS